VQMLNTLLKNSTVNINVIDPWSGVNSFWLACLYGHGKIMKILAEQGAEIYNTNKQLVNVLHLAIYNNNE